jgi:hypothetical protein
MMAAAQCFKNLSLHLRPRPKPSAKKIIRGNDIGHTSKPPPAGTLDQSY